MTSPKSEFAWGAPDADGVAIGIAIAGEAPADRCVYRIAVANQSAEPRQVVLFATLDDRIRTRIVARQGDGEEVRPAVMPGAAVSANVRIVVDLAPGQIVERDATPARFAIAGDAVVQVVLGGVPAHPAELRSAEVPVRLVAPS